MNFPIIWPERRQVSNDQVQTWAKDAVENDELGPDEVDLDDPASCATALHQAGLITLSD